MYALCRTYENFKISFENINLLFLLKCLATDPLPEKTSATDIILSISPLKDLSINSKIYSLIKFIEYFDFTRMMLMP